MMYNPNNPLSNEEIEKLNDYELFEYLDSKSKYMEQFSAPLSGYKLKRYAYTSVAIDGGKISGDHHKDLEYRDWETDRKSTRLNSSHLKLSRMPSSA